MGGTFYSRMFLLAALWNGLAAVTGLAFYEFQFRLFFGQEAYTESFYQALTYRTSMTAVLLFGIGYYLVSRQIRANRGIVWLGALGKLLLFGTFTYFFMMNKVTLAGFGIVLGDLIWAMLFLTFLIHTRGKVQHGFFIG